jgi:hypothetical protein
MRPCLIREGIRRVLVGEGAQVALEKRRQPDKGVDSGVDARSRGG